MLKILVDLMASMNNMNNLGFGLWIMDFHTTYRLIQLGLGWLASNKLDRARIYIGLGITYIFYFGIKIWVALSDGNQHK